MIIESLTMEKNSSRIIHVLKPSKKESTFKMGRGHDAEVRVNDISVSRTHAIIKYKDNQFYIEDNSSKFGTLVLVKDSIPLEINHTKAV